MSRHSAAHGGIPWTYVGHYYISWRDGSLTTPSEPMRPSHLGKDKTRWMRQYQHITVLQCFASRSSLRIVSMAYSKERTGPQIVRTYDNSENPAKRDLLVIPDYAKRRKRTVAVIITNANHATYGAMSNYCDGSQNESSYISSFTHCVEANFSLTWFNMYRRAERRPYNKNQCERGQRTPVCGS